MKERLASGSSRSGVHGGTWALEKGAGDGEAPGRRLGVRFGAGKQRRGERLGATTRIEDEKIRSVPFGSDEGVAELEAWRGGLGGFSGTMNREESETWQRHAGLLLLAGDEGAAMDRKKRPTMVSCGGNRERERDERGK